MLDLTDSHPELISSPPAAEVATQKRHQIMLARGLIAKMARSLSHSGGGMQGVLVKQLAQQGAARIERQLVQNNAEQTQALTSFLLWTTQAVNDSDCSDEQFIADFGRAYDDLEAAFPTEDE